MVTGGTDVPPDVFEGDWLVLAVDVGEVGETSGLVAASGVFIGLVCDGDCPPDVQARTESIIDTNNKGMKSLIFFISFSREGLCIRTDAKYIIYAKYQ